MYNILPQLLISIISIYLVTACSNTEKNKQWGTAQILAENAESPQISTDLSGNAILVWQDATEQTVINAAAKFFSKSSKWKEKVIIENTNISHAYSPQIAFDGDGNAIAVWYQGVEPQQNTFPPDSIWANRYTPESGWGIPQLLETDESGRASSPVIVFDNNNNATVTWHQSDGTNINIWSNRYTPNTGWGIAELIESNDSGDALFPNIAIDNDNNVIAVWSQSDSNVSNIWANRYTLDNGWGTAQLLETDDAGDAYSPKIVFDDVGNAFAIWLQSDGIYTSTRSNRYEDNNGWQQPQLIGMNNTTLAYAADINVDKNGNAIAVWIQATTPSTIDDGLWSNHYTTGNGWNDAIPIGSNISNGAATQPNIEITDSGNATVIWQQETFQNNNSLTKNTRARLAPQYRTYINNYNKITGWGKPITIDNGVTGYSSSQAKLVLDNEGNAIAVWESGFKLWWNSFE